MTKLHHRIRSKANASLISIAQRFSDILIIFLGLYIVCTVNDINFGIKHLLSCLLVLTIFQMIGGITDFYRSWRGVKLISELDLLIKNWTLSLILMVGILSYSKDLTFNFRISFEWYIIVSVGVIICRMIIRYVARFIRHLGYNTRNVAIAGSMPVGVSLAKSFNDEPWLGFVVVGLYDINPPNTNFSDIEYKGNFEQLISDAKKGKLDRIYIAMSMSENNEMKELIKSLTDTTCSVLLIPDIFTFNILQSRVEEVNGVPVVPLFDTPLSGINMVFKRVEDIIISALILILISPVLAIIAIAVKTTSSGPILFRQTRYGMDGKPIKVWKFRSMTVMENDDTVRQATKNDVRITRVGNVLRKTSLDELPQFFNVLLGGMSIVGPRPHAVSHNEQYRNLIEGYMLRHKVKPGITGWAQINGWRGETDTLDKMEKRVEFDLEYIRNWSIYFDLKIIFLTIFKGFVNKAAY
ncbi:MULTISPECIES: undecaprenyl-phosphate glucose phosphotransferase [Enterobacteriaceae]|uniref:undecaprenyl-phosphate glucose phosphotransferase n=1 Tax=Enterobacteriaceae TaxID=543 RepID=UPI000927A548|nr:MULTISPECIES: undecaprenyl-phosphate glucose phosphotransferase [Enterobacteriaceae]AWX86767.1 undecaprenyl-phosphate glucose phosphotransferase [Klebsiella quasipneumoniae subsp. quasipneumoniae]EFI2178174.1 undecaprenyl-phosphate glucose phosphotransferase [Escherichia coli]EHR8626199.1 undecaprenyl-phosphate glucose phosphotransferase [Escherichia coli]MBG0950386.1 undecaprenyl-phosphate glucose phosphotransferase [Escherichia coli]MBK2729516.1 undecaprenyl-phosphate glucose phosphotrans